MRKVIPGIKNLRNLSLKHAPVTHEDVYLAIKYGKYLSTVSVEGSLVDLKGYGRKASFVNGESMCSSGDEAKLAFNSCCLSKILQIEKVMF